jgi:hypothetical protein
MVHPIDFYRSEYVACTLYMKFQPKHVRLGISPAPQSNKGLMTAAALISHGSHFLSLCSSSFSKL